MKEFNLIVGCGNRPDGYNGWKRIDSFEEMTNYIGVKGKIRLHLHGQWETVIAPNQIRQVLMNWYPNKIQPIVTISL